MVTQLHWHTVQRIVQLLSEERYDAVMQLCEESRVSAEEMKTAVATYGRTIVPLPPEAAGLISSIQVRKAASPTWSIVVPLFTVEEGRSDLSLELTVTESQPGLVRAKIDDLHVL